MATFKRTHYVPARERVRAAIDAEEAAVINRSAVHALTEYRSLALGNRTYRIPPLPYKVGLELDGLLARYRRFALANKLDPLPDDPTPQQLERHLQADAEMSRQFAAWLRDVAAVCGPWVWPTYGIARWLHRALRAVGAQSWAFPNPLRKATEGELIAVLNFFQQCRTKDPVRKGFRLGSPAPAP